MKFNHDAAISPSKLQQSMRDRRGADRRLFLRTLAGLGLCGVVGQRAGADEDFADSSPNKPSKSGDATPNEKVTLGIMGVNGRGSAIARGMLASGQTNIAYVCDVDERAAARAMELISNDQKLAPAVVSDFREILEDDSVDALVCAAPNHWHAPATIAGCAAGKHVYVEKPCSHTPEEGEMAIAAARKANRVVQMGTQRRSWPAIVQAIEKVHGGEIGKALYSRCWYNNRRGSIGVGKSTAVPDWLDWKMWQGPAPERPYKDNLVHYNWHWHWHWGNGELGNNGVHGIDVARWALQVRYPVRVTAGGGKYRHQDDQETPDTMNVTMEFPEQKSITWEGISWSPLRTHGSTFGISIHGTEGSIVITGANFIRYDMKGNEVERQESKGGDADHFADFLDAVRTGRRPNADIEEAHQSTLLCHLGNIAYRTSSVLNLDGNTGRIQNNPEAAALWTREYAPGWEPSV